MRVESALVQQSLIETPKAVETKEVKTNGYNNLEVADEQLAFTPSTIGSGRTYSLSSLKAAVDYHAKFLTVAESNMQAIHHPGAIPQVLLDRLNRRQNSMS